MIARRVGGVLLVLAFLGAMLGLVDDTAFVWLLVLGVGSLIVGGAYDMGYKQGQADILNPPSLRPLTEDERNRLLMRLTLPRWRRVLGWAAIVVPGLLFWVLMDALIRYRASGWLYLVGGVGFIVLLGLSAGLSDWFWRPYRRAQAERDEARRKQEWQEWDDARRKREGGT
jgi:hypothetical protein